MNTRQETLEKNVMLADLLLYKNGDWEGNKEAEAVLLEEKEKALKELNHIEKATGYTVYAETGGHNACQRFITLYRGFSTKTEAEEFFAGTRELTIKDWGIDEEWRIQANSSDKYEADLSDYHSWLRLGILEDIRVPLYLAKWEKETVVLRVENS